MRPIQITIIAAFIIMAGATSAAADASFATSDDTHSDTVAGASTDESPAPPCCRRCKEPDPDKEVLHSTSGPLPALQDELFLGTVLITAWGVYHWDWFSHSFHFKKEHGFTQQSSTGGGDKMGHAWTSFLFADFLGYQLRNHGFPRIRSSIAGGLASMLLMTWIEIGDGTSAYGFSWEDMLADFLGASLSTLLGIFPAADAVVDFRIQYWPTSEYFKSGDLVADYSGMKFLVALQLSGIPALRKTPLRFVELHGGYYSRGFRTFDTNQEDTVRAVYMGFGLDVYEVLRPILGNPLKKPAKALLSYYQIPLLSFEAVTFELDGDDAAPVQEATTILP